MNRKKQKKLNSLNIVKKSKNDNNNNKDETILNIEYIENLSLFKFKQLLNSASSKDIEKALYSIIRLIREVKEKQQDDQDDQEDQEEDNEIELNHKNKNLSIVFEYLKQSQQLTELFTIWDTCIDKYQVYQTCYSLLLEFIAIIITINDDPSLQFQTRILADKIISNRFIDLQKIITGYNDDTINLTLNCYRLLSSIVPLSIKIAKTLQTNIDFNSNGFQKAMMDITSNGAYLGTRPYVLRFLLSFLKHHNLKLNEFILESDYLLPKYCSKLQLDHHNVILDLIESLESNVLKVDYNVVPKKLKIKFFSTSFLSKIGLVFSKDDIGEESRQSIYKFLSILCCSSNYGIISSDPKWTWFRENDLPCFENKSIVSLITELNPIAYQTHQSLFIKIINACPDLFTSYLKKLGYCEVSLSLNWLNRTTMLIKTLSSPVPTKPNITSELLIPSTPIVLINLLIPPQLNNLSFGFDIDSNLVTYNQCLVLQLCLKRINLVLNSINLYIIEQQQQQQQQQQKDNSNRDLENLINFYENLKNGLKEKLPSFRYFKEHFNQFKSCNDTIYNQFISICSEYVKFLPINEFITLKMFDYNLILKSDLYTQKQFIQLISSSKTFNTVQNLFNKENGENQSIINMILKLYLDCTNNNNKLQELKDYYHQLLFKLLSINNLYSSVDSEIDYWLDFIGIENLEFFELTLTNSHQNKFHYVNLIQNLQKKLFGNDSNQLLISPVLLSGIFQIFTGLPSNQYKYLSEILISISSLSKNNSLLILSIFNYINNKQQGVEKEINYEQPIQFKNLPIEFNCLIKFLYNQSFSNKFSDDDNDSSGEQLNKLILNCSSPKEIKFIISNNINKPFLLNIITSPSSKNSLNESSRFIQSIKFIPINLLLSQFNLIQDQSKKIEIISNQFIKNQIILSIKLLSQRKLISQIQLIENLIINQFNNNESVDLVFNFYFELLEIIFNLILESKSSNALKSIESFLQNQSLILSNYLINFKLTLNLSKLLLVLFNFNYKQQNNNNINNGDQLNLILSPFINNLFIQFNKKSIKESINSKKINNSFILSIRVLGLILPYLEYNLLIKLLNEFKEFDIKSLSSNDLILQIYLEIIDSILKILNNNSSNNNNNILPKYITVFNFNENSINQDISTTSTTTIPLTTSSNLIKYNNENNELLKSIFIQLIQLSLEFNSDNNNNENNNNSIYKITIDQFIYQFLLIDLNQINLSTNILISLICSKNELISKYLNYCFENCSPITLQIILIILFENNNILSIPLTTKISFKLFNFTKLFQYDITIWLPLIYWLIIKEKSQEILKNNQILNQIYKSISNSNIFERNINSSLISITIDLFKYLSRKLNETNSKLNYLLLFENINNNDQQLQSEEDINNQMEEYDHSVIKTMITNYLNNLSICLKNNFKDLLNLLISNLNNIIFKNINLLNFEAIIKICFANQSNLNQNLEIIEKIIFNMESSTKYQLYIDLIFKSIISNQFIIDLIKTIDTNSIQDNQEIQDKESLLENNDNDDHDDGPTLTKSLIKYKSLIDDTNHDIKRFDPDNNNLLKYRLLRILLKIYYKDPSYCNSNQNSILTSIYFNIYNATVHPIDKILLKIIYQHETNGYSILQESNYLWGKHSKESSSITQLLLSNTIFSGNIFENSINNFPFEVNTLIEINENQNQINKQQQQKIEEDEDYKFNRNNKSNYNDDIMNFDSDDDDDDDNNEQQEKEEQVNIQNLLNQEYNNNEKENLEIIKSYKEFSYDPTFILRLLTSLLDSYISEFSNLDSQQEDFRKENVENLWRVLNCFFYNGPFSFTVRSLSSKHLAIRQISYQILSKYQSLLNTYQEQQQKTFDESFSTKSNKKQQHQKQKQGNSQQQKLKSNFNNEKIIIKLIQVLKSSIFEKDQYVSPIYSLFYCLSIKTISNKSDAAKRKSIISYFKGITLLDFTHIPMFSMVLNFSVNKSTIISILEMISIALPDQHVEILLKKNNSISSLMGLFDSNISNSKIKSLILEIILKLSSSKTGGLYLIIKQQGVLPWLTLLISNPSCPKSLFDNVFLILITIIKNLNNLSLLSNQQQQQQQQQQQYTNYNEISQISIILNNLFKLILNLNCWNNNQFKFILLNYFNSLNSILSTNSSFIKLSNSDLVLLIQKFDSLLLDSKFFNNNSNFEKLKLKQSIVSTISYSKLSIGCNDNDQVNNQIILNWILDLLNHININDNGNNQEQDYQLLFSILKWIQDSLLNSREFIKLLKSFEIKFLNQLISILVKLEISLTINQSLKESFKNTISIISALLLSSDSNQLIKSKKGFDQNQLLELIDKIPSPFNQKSDDSLISNNNNVDQFLHYIINLFFGSK